MEVQFPLMQVHDTSREVVRFPARVDGKKVDCAVSMEALHDAFGDESGELLEVFQANREKVQDKAKQLLRAQRFEADGSILIRTADLS